MKNQDAHLASHSQQERNLTTLPSYTRQDFLDYENSVDAWRQHRMMDPVQVLANIESWSWLTIGDVNGWDAARLTGMGVANVTASDLSGTRLEQAEREGMIESFRVENAESMSASSGSFDIVFCKEAFHHLPRPWLGLYEMLRVARKAVVLIEPRDWIIDRGPITLRGPRDIIKTFSGWLKSRMGLRHKPLPPVRLFQLGDEPHYEKVGNYMFSLSARELEKVALGLDLPAVAFKSVNDYFEEGLWKHRAEPGSAVLERVKGILAGADARSEGGLGSSSMLLSVLFVEMPDQGIQSEMEKAGWAFLRLNRNPYLLRGVDAMP